MVPLSNLPVASSLPICIAFFSLATLLMTIEGVS
jgi:hypothetical protein